MANLEGREKTTTIRRMFGRIAPRYNLLNRLMTFGQDLAWRREAVSQLELGQAGLVLDNGCGTGDLILEVSKRYPSARLVASDLTPEMVALARQRPGAEKVFWLIADAQCLPFTPGVFQAVISGYLLRNLPDVPAALLEQWRIIKPGGGMVTLDSTPPQPGLFYPLIKFYFRWIIPLLGRLIAGDREAYTYLPRSTEQFLTAEQLAQCLRSAGYEKVSYVRLMFGTMAIHRARKPASPTPAANSAL